MVDRRPVVSNGGEREEIRTADTLILDTPGAAGDVAQRWLTENAFPIVMEVDPHGTGAPSLDRGAAGFLGFMREANFPQIIAGAQTSTGSFFIDAENDRPMFLNALHTGEVVISQGGLMGENAVTDIGRSQNGNAGVPFRDCLLSRGIGVHGNTPPVAKISVTGSRGGNAALASFLTAMATYGHIIDNTTP